MLVWADSNPLIDFTTTKNLDKKGMQKEEVSINKISDYTSEAISKKIINHTSATMANIKLFSSRGVAHGYSQP
ncbi:hypothetical protein EEL30_00250 (plasmid) [Brevibacillus laterosporus]|uniref:Uncharacterized protein n=1 Tax=Brevibacillus laterosporus TaxID=1465 RepID=A0A518V1T3_BRELA|nr:hypothetical protein EEL30_00250 [Brevibacillus laterosporus]